MNPVDKAVLELMQNIHHPILEELMLIITHAASYTVLFLIILLLVYLRRKELSSNMLIGLLIEGIIIVTLKGITARPRPLIRNLSPNASFPSGHTSRSTYLAFLFEREWSKKLIWFSLASLVIFSRLYLQVHYFTDIFGGIVVGYFVYWLVIKYELGLRAYEKISEKIPLIEKLFESEEKEPRDLLSI